jgi:hypothetical protein
MVTIANARRRARLAGAPLDPTANYRVTVSIYRTDDGDEFATLKEGTRRV